jgi:hypothetical protein
VVELADVLRRFAGPYLVSGTFRSTRETGFLAFSPLLSRGTEGSNPAPSSKESGANLPRCAHLHGRRVTVFCSEEFALLPSDDDFATGNRKFESISLQQTVACGASPPP